MTQLQSARKGVITPEMARIARIVTLLFTMSAGCSGTTVSGRGSDDRISHHESSSDDPCIVVWKQDGYVPKPNNGLQTAVWRDGAILFSPVCTALGVHMLVGQTQREDVEEVLQTMRASGLADRTDNYVVPDGGYTIIIIRDNGKETRHVWHEQLNPGFGSDINTDVRYRKFVRSWKKTLGAIDSLAPVHVKRLADEVGEAVQYRGYMIEAPSSTAWSRKQGNPG